VGDLNVDANNPLHPQKFLKNYPSLSKQFKNCYNEYEGLMFILSDNSNFKVVDLLKVYFLLFKIEK